jgi:hypothetical protein
MKKLYIILCLLLSLLSAAAQYRPQDDFAKNPDLSASNMVAYPIPTNRLTPAPKGKKPFYLSHYGRHGSRYLTKTKDYEEPVNIFMQAEKLGKLTPLGQDVLKRIILLRDEAQGRWGDLTEVGARQHREIMKRMVCNYPSLFKGDAHVEAHSTLIPRCVLSMTHALMELTRSYPHLNISLDASPHELYYMNHQDKKLIEERSKGNPEEVYKRFASRHRKSDRLLESLFNDTAYIRQHIKPDEFCYYLFRLAGSIQDTDLAEQMTLYDIFTPDEILENWRIDNVWWYLGFGATPVNGGTQPYMQRFLLRTIIEQADSCIGLRNNNVHLRFGHDTMVLPLVCLMALNHYDQSIDDLEQLDTRGWLNYKIFPMACNLQIVFYRNNPDDPDVLVKILLNEEEATLPLKSDITPYYHWKDVRTFFLQRLNSYQE